MQIFPFLPGLDHIRLGERRKGMILLGCFAPLASLALWRAGIIWESMVHTARKITGEKVLYSERHLDIFIAASALLILLAAAIFYSWISCRRLAKSSGHAKRESQGLWAVAWRQFKKNRLATTGASILIALYLIAIFCPLITAYDPTEQGHLVKERLLKPSLDHLLGTDRFSRDVFSRILHGSRISLLVGFLAVGISITIGTVYGAVAGYFGRWIDSILMRFVDMMLSFPTLILIITIVAISKSQSIWLIIAVIGLTSWMGVARLVRGEILLLKELDFFQASRALGAGAFRLIFRHLLPNAMTPIIVAATLRVGSTILLEASLSYLGLGVQPPTPSWGNIIYDTKENIFTEWWMPLSAGLAITITVVGYNLLGDGLRDALDPKMRR